MNQYIYSPSENAFYAVNLKNTYEVNGTWPADALDIPDNISVKYMAEPPQGKIRVAGVNGLKYLNHHMKNLFNRQNQKDNYCLIRPTNT